MTGSALALSVCLTIAGCGRSGHDPAHGDASSIGVMTLAANTRAARSSRIEIRNTNVGPAWKDAPGSVSVGVVDFAHNRSALTDRITRRHGTVDVAESRSIGRDAYTRDPGATDPTPKPGRPWVKNSFPGVATSFGDAQLSSVVDAAAVTGGAVNRVGTERIRGVATTRYRINRFESAPAKLRELGYHSGGGTMSVWADDRGRIRRFVSEQSFPSPADHTTTRVDLYDFGTSVTVTAPPARQVTAGHFMDQPRTGPEVVVGRGHAGKFVWRVSRYSINRHGACLSIAVRHIESRPTTAGRAAPASCWQQTDESDPLDLRLQVLPNGSQLVTGIVSSKVRSVTVHYDDGTTRAMTPTHLGLAFSISGNRVATTIEPGIDGEDWTCKLDFSGLSASSPFYNCSGGSATRPVTAPPIGTRPPEIAGRRAPGPAQPGDAGAP